MHHHANMHPCFQFLLAALIVAAITGCGDREKRATPPPEADTPEARTIEGPAPIKARMHDVHFNVDEIVQLEIRELRGLLEPTDKNTPPHFDEPSTFQIVIEEGEVAITPESLAGLMNRYVFGYEKAPISGLELEITEEGLLRQKGTLRKLGGVPFMMEGSVSATPAGDIQMKPEKLKVSGLPVKTLMELFDIELAEVIKAEHARGLQIYEDTLVIDPEQVLPPPRIRGAITNISIKDGRIVQTFSAGTQDEIKPPVSDRGYMFFLGGKLRFGKLLMQDADLEIADEDPSDPFLFYLSEFQKQLVAGYSKTPEDKGLIAYMPDHDDIEPAQ